MKLPLWMFPAITATVGFIVVLIVVVGSGSGGLGAGLAQDTMPGSYQGHDLADYQHIAQSLAWATGSLKTAQNNTDEAKFCQDITEDAQAGLALPATTITDFDSHWQQAMTLYAATGTECQNAIANNDQSQMTQASQSVSSAYAAFHAAMIAIGGTA